MGEMDNQYSESHIINNIKPCNMFGDLVGRCIYAQKGWHFYQLKKKHTSFSNQYQPLFQVNDVLLIKNMACDNGTNNHS